MERTRVETPRPAPPGTDPVAFFRAQEAACDGDSTEHRLFTGAKRIRDLGGGSTLIEDGAGTRLVVVPRRGVVLPSSGDAEDLTPMPYRYTCAWQVFLGSTDH